MSQTLHSLSVYEEIVAHTNLKMMTKVTDLVEPSTECWSEGKERSEAFRNAWISFTEATLVDRKERKLLSSDFE